MERDPMRPLYEVDPLKRILNERDQVIINAIRFLQLINPKTMAYWSKEDDQDAIESLSNFGKGFLQKAFEELKLLARNKVCDFGDFFRLANSIAREQADKQPAFKADSDPNDWREREMQLALQHQERIANAPEFGRKEIARYWLPLIREDLKKAGGLLKPLPYNKNKRVSK